VKAIVHTKYGPPDELQLQEVEKPVPKEDEVLIKIHATTVTTSDCNVRNFTFVPKLFLLPSRMNSGFKKPKIKILGVDLAGEIEAVGKDVKRFKEGDHIFGTPEPALGAHAEYICIPEDGALTIKPAKTTWEEAASIPVAGNAALYFIRDLGNVQAGQTVLINGASGAIGTFAVQLAKYYGAEVTGVCSTTNLELVKSLGADKVIDYTKEDFTKTGQTYDVIFDAVGKSSFSRCKSSLKKEGIYLVTLPKLAVLLQMLWTSIIGSKKVKMGDAVGKVGNLLFLKELTEAGKLKAVIDRRYPLEQTAEAFRYVEQGHKKGNVVITVEHEDKTPSARADSEVVEPTRRGATNIIDIEGIGPVYAEKLRAIGIKTTIDLLEAGNTPLEREELAEKTGISPKLILEWVNIADLIRIKGVGEEYSDLLEEAGVASVVDLSRRDPEDLHAKLLKVNEEKTLVRRVPSLNAVRDWIALARADDVLDDLFLTYDENLKGGAHAVKADDTSRPRSRSSGAKMDMAIGMGASELPAMMRPETSLNESIEKASEPHSRDYEDNPKVVEAIEKTAYDLGASLVSFTEVTPNVVYADKEVPYRYVVVVAIRMDSEKVATAPSRDFGLETANTTVALGVLVNRLADRIKEMGYDAVPGPALGGPVDYPSLGRMAGMGEFGRHGMLISQFNGACQRIAAVFTNLVLPVAESNPHEWVRDFCVSCGKCIRACPPNAIREESVPTKAGHYSCVEAGNCLLYLVTHLGCSICIKECPFTTTGYVRIKEAFDRGAR
jgi:NADPH:quinone reductase-like Zn-dependent oxidoreductase/ferredoxin